MREESLVINHGAEGSERGKVETEGRKEGGSKRVRSLTSFDTLSEKHSAKLHARADLQWQRPPYADLSAVEHSDDAEQT